MAILITGGLGFVGLNLLEAFLAEGEEVVLFDLGSMPKSAEADLVGYAGRWHGVKGDIRDGGMVRDVIRSHRIDRIVHGAVITADEARERRDPASIIEVNLLGTVRLFEAAKAEGVRRVLSISSSSAYGETVYRAAEVDEEAPARPRSLYEITKYAGERTSLRLGALFGIPVVTTRLSVVFGPWERETGFRDTLSAPLQVTRLALRGEEAVLPREGNADWVYSRDVAAALVHLLGTTTEHGVYNVAQGGRWTLAAWCTRLAERLPAFRWRVAKGGEPANVHLYFPHDPASFDVARLVAAGYRPRFGLDEAFADYMAWLDRHKDVVGA